MLLENPTDDSVEVAVGFVTECGSILQDLSPKGLHGMISLELELFAMLCDFICLLFYVFMLHPTNVYQKLISLSPHHHLSSSYFFVGKAITG